MPDEECRPEEPVEIVPYDRTWPARFEREKAVIHEAMGAVATEVHHIGSTAVPGLAAKPIIDILVAVDPLEDRSSLQRSLAKVGYTYVPYEGDEVRLYFRKGTPRRYHVHVVIRDSTTYRKLLLFRDALMSDPGLRVDYERLKMELARTHRHDRQAYSDAKAEFVESVVMKASSDR